MPDDNILQKIEDFFLVPDRVKDQIQNIAEKTKGGYVLYETRPRWEGAPPGPWTKMPIAKIIYNKPSKSWRLYWARALGKWERYPNKVKSLDGVLQVIKDDKHGCFWG